MDRPIRFPLPVTKQCLPLRTISPYIGGKVRAVNSFTEKIENELAKLRETESYRSLSPRAAQSFVHNDYLGLSKHPDILAAGVATLKKMGAGAGGSRLLGGHSSLFEELEQEIARYFAAPAAIFFSSGYLANLAAVTVVAPFVEHIFSDSLNHASLIDGIRLSGKPRTVVPHGEWRGVHSELLGPSLLVSESLFSMDGDFVDTEALKTFAEDPRAFLLLDEAHAAGVFGGGRGIHSFWQGWDRKLVTVTFGKAFGAAGAALLCSREMREWIINSARSFIYSTAPAPVLAGMVLKSLDVSAKEGWRREKLLERSRYVRRILQERVPTLIKPEKSTLEQSSMILALRVSGERNALRFAQTVRQSLIDVRAIRYPTVARGQERVRLSLNIEMPDSAVDVLIEKLVQTWTEFSL